MARSETGGARAAMSPAQLTIRKCESIAELEACVQMQKEVWNFADVDLIPLRMFVVAQKIGGQVIGAFDDQELVGFALSIPGSRSGHAYLHSHMLAVREAYRNSGTGRKLKLAQRDEALERGIELIEWTFDPLEIKNAYLNIARLGAISRRYNLNQYGMSSSPLQGGLPTDRLVAEWWLSSKRVQSLLADGAPEIKAEVAIDVPAEVYAWKSSAEHRERAKQVQARNRDVFLESFRRGLAVMGYERDAQGNGTFLLANWEEPWSYAGGAANES